jgi:predicted N-acetyltransferase YhbS
MIEYGFLADHLEFIEEISEFSYQEWPLESQIDESLFSVQDVCKMFREEYAQGRGEILNSAIVAYSKSEFVGIVIMTDSDIKSKKDQFKYSPWIANLFVKESFRKRKVGRELVEKCCQMAKKLGYSKVYLWTKKETQNWYELQGFKYVEELFHIHQIIVIMSKEIL